MSCKTKRDSNEIQNLPDQFFFIYVQFPLSIITLISLLFVPACVWLEHGKAGSELCFCVEV